MTDKVIIHSPQGGKPIWVLMICFKDDIIGHIKFDEYEAMVKFRNAYSTLPSNEWGLMTLDIDTYPDKEKP